MLRFMNGVILRLYELKFALHFSFYYLLNNFHYKNKISFLADYRMTFICNLVLVALLFQELFFFSEEIQL